MDAGAGNRDDLEAAAVRASETPSSRNPVAGDWGFCVSGDAPGAIGGGVPSFYWFSSREEMLAFLGAHAAHLSPVGEDIDPEAMMVSARSALDVDGGDGALLVALNEALRPSSEFEWIGSFEALAGGPDTFACQLRRDYRDGEEVRGGDAPIGKPRLRSFAEYTLSYGI